MRKTTPGEGPGSLREVGYILERASHSRSTTTHRRTVVAGRSELGQSILEYALVIAVVALVVIAIIWMIGPQLAAVFSSVYESVVIIPTPPTG